MEIIFVSNFFNHHQRPLSEELYKLTGGKFIFIETIPMPSRFKDSGYIMTDNPTFLFQSWKSKEAKLKAEKLMLNTEVLLMGAYTNYTLLRNRLSKGRLTFEVGERWLKRGLLNLLSPRLLKSQLFYHLYSYKKPLYHLNASAYAANDLKFLHSFKNKMFKWGYFTEIPKLDSDIKKNNSGSSVKILFVGRFLGWKHPELAVLLAENLVEKGFEFQIDMYGNGPLLKKIEDLILQKGLSNIVNLKGNIPNYELLKEMQKHDIFIFTSDKHEGWGAVLNEAMSSECAVVASDEIGAVPFLIEDGKNGLIFNNGDLLDLTSKVELLIKKPELRNTLAKKARSTIQKTWSPRAAAENLVSLINGIKNNNPTIILSGPGSSAYPIH